MAWLVEDRRAEKVAAGEPLLTEALKSHLREKYFPRYPTKRAVTLPALHLVQHTYGWIPMQAIAEVAEFLELAPAEVLDTATFYEEYWLKPKGKYLLAVCRSLSCELCGSEQITRHVQDKLGVELHETTADKRFTLIELECLGACGTAPVMLINDVLHENLDVETVDQLIAKLPEDPHDYADPTVTWESADEHGAADEVDGNCLAAPPQDRLSFVAGWRGPADAPLTGFASRASPLCPRSGVMSKITINLKKPMPASNDWLLHVAMNLGAARGVGLRPVPGMVSRLVIQPQLDAWCLFRLDASGGFVGDSWHPSKEDALHQARKEFGAENGDLADAG